MTVVKFICESYGEMTTTAENWIKYTLFDAQTTDGESYPVIKSDCRLLETLEY